MKKIAFTIAALSLLSNFSLGGPMIAQGAGIRWVSYQSAPLAFQIKVPKAWQVRPSAKAVGFTSPARGDSRAAIGVLRSADRHSTIEQAVQKEFELEGQPEDWQQSYARVGGMQAVKIVKNAAVQPNLKIVEYYVQGPHGPYILQCVGPRDRWNLYAPLFATMLKTFRFTN
jgi:hypothetical protein